MEDRIDLIVPYVDSSDPEWLKAYEEWAPKVGDPAVDGRQRFRGQGMFFRYFFRGVEKYMPWVGRVILIVASESQVPDWLDRNSQKLLVVTHREFMPDWALPTFNSAAIEAFLWNVPGLSERFVYTNDDTLAIGPMGLEDFFADGKVLARFGRLSEEPLARGNVWYSHCANSEAVGLGLPREEALAKFGLLCCEHAMRPMLRSLAAECHEARKAEMDASVTRFRDVKNVNAYVYWHYAEAKGLVAPSKLAVRTVDAGTPKRDLRDIVCPPTQCLCVQDKSEDRDVYSGYELRFRMDKLLKAKSSFEK